MERRDFLQKAGAGAIALMGLTALGGAASLKTWAQEMADSPDAETKMPALFCGHGSPMIAIEESNFTRRMATLGQELPRPRAILVVSAHWLTEGTWVNGSARPKMIYDMYGFPDALYQVKYESPGAPDTAREVQALVKSTEVGWDTDWGYDHGTWTLLSRLYPGADIPVFQLSIDYRKPPAYHYALAKELKELRKKGVLIIGSGNMTHNLGNFNPVDGAPPMDWAVEFDQKMKGFLDSGNHQAVVDYQNLGRLAKLAHPEPSHFLPLLYAIGLQETGEALTYPHEEMVYGSLSMRCVRVG